MRISSAVLARRLMGATVRRTGFAAIARTAYLTSTERCIGPCLRTAVLAILSPSPSGVSHSGVFCEGMSMTLRLRALTVTPAILLAMFLGTARADAATHLGSPDTAAPPDAFACADCPPGTSIGLQQFALRGALTEAP